MLPLKHKTTDPADDAKKNVVSHEKFRKKNIETKLPHLWNHHKNWVVGCISGSVECLCVVYEQNSSVGSIHPCYHIPYPQCP